jgi:hypothetical protein
VRSAVAIAESGDNSISRAKHAGLRIEAGMDVCERYTRGCNLWSIAYKEQSFIDSSELPPLGPSSINVSRYSTATLSCCRVEKPEEIEAKPDFNLLKISIEIISA